jgi:ATP-binding cassette subfamily B protein
MALDNADGRVNNAVASFFQIIAGVAASTVAFYAMYTIDPYSIFFVVLPILGQFVFATISSKIERKRYTENTINQRKASYVNRVLYLAEFAKEVRMSNICRLMMRRFDESIKGTHAVVDKYAVKGTLFTWIQIVITFALVFEGIMLYAAYRAIVSRTMGLAELTIMFSAMVASSWIFIGLFRSIGDLIKNCVFIGYLRDFIEYKETISEDQDGIIPEKYVNSIEFRNVSFNYKDTSAVKNISFIIKCGQTVAFTGHNGAGKSTLIKLLLRLYDPTEGTILVNGTDIKYYNLKEYRKLFAAAFQDYKIFSLPVTDNILLNEGEEETNENQVIDALSRVGIREKVDLFPKGIHTTLTKEFDEDGVVLSGGETQKIAVARALAKSAAVKVYDEPSSALDPISEYNLYTSIMSASKGQTTIFISHRLSSVSDADLVFLFEKGELIEQGCHTTLIANNKKYAEMYNMQARNYLADEAFKEKAV